MAQLWTIATDSYADYWEKNIEGISAIMKLMKTLQSLWASAH